MKAKQTYSAACLLFHIVWHEWKWASMAVLPMWFIILSPSSLFRERPVSVRLSLSLEHHACWFFLIRRSHYCHPSCNFIQSIHCYDRREDLTVLDAVEWRNYVIPFLSSLAGCSCMASLAAASASGRDARWRKTLHIYSISIFMYFAITEGIVAW